MSKSNEHAGDGIDQPKNSAAEIDPSVYMCDEKPAAAEPISTEAYTEPEENIVNIVPVGLGAVSVRARPPKDEWFRSHPDGSMSIGMRLLKGKMGEMHAIRNELIPIAGTEVHKALITASVTSCMTIDGAKFLWAILHPSG